MLKNKDKTFDFIKNCKKSKIGMLGGEFPLVYMQIVAKEVRYQRKKNTSQKIKITI